MKLDDMNSKCTLELETSTCECVNTVYKGDSASLPRCPQCGESYYMENFGITTAVYYPPIYKDGVNINPDRNKTSVNCTCMNCSTEFSFTR